MIQPSKWDECAAGHKACGGFDVPLAQGYNGVAPMRAPGCGTTDVAMSPLQAAVCPQLRNNWPGSRSACKQLKQIRTNLVSTDCERIMRR
jgi:hypothetical protein